VVHKDSIANKEFIDREYTTPNFVALKKNNFETVFQNDILEGERCLVSITTTVDITRRAFIN
jgi:hypothetical protein